MRQQTIIPRRKGTCNWEKGALQLLQLSAQSQFLDYAIGRGTQKEPNSLIVLKREKSEFRQAKGLEFGGQDTSRVLCRKRALEICTGVPLRLWLNANLVMGQVELYKSSCMLELSRKKLFPGNQNLKNPKSLYKYGKHLGSQSLKKPN